MPRQTGIRKSGHKTPFIRKGGGKSFNYKWGPQQDLPKNVNERNAKRKKEIITKICTATPGSQGIDNVVEYVWNQMLVNDVIEHAAYVECNYVE